VGGTFCDLRKAFDCVDHGILLNKLLKYGIIGKSHKLISSYLANRYQRVIIAGKCKTFNSEWKLIKQGVPQGSILGPLLFLIYINDFPIHAQPSTKTVLFADDTSMVIKSAHPTEFTNAIQNNLIDADKWFKENLLTLNTDKTNILQFYTRNELPDLRILYGDKQLHTVNTTKFLGIIIDSTLSWKQHVDNITSKLNKACFAIRTVKAYVATAILKTIYFSYFHSVMTYGVIFWGNSVGSKHIFKIQKGVIKIIYNLKVRDSFRTAFKNLEILPFYSQYLYSLLMFVAKTESYFKIMPTITHLTQDIKTIFTYHQQI